MMIRRWLYATTLLLVILLVFAFTGCDEFFPSESKVDSVKISPTSLFMKSGDTQQFTATTVTLGGTETDVTNTAGWSSSNTAIVDVDRKGLATAKTRSTLGTATITVSASGKSATTSVSVESGKLTSITLGPSQSTLTVGATLQLTASGSFDDNSTATITNLVSWSSSNTAVATISSTGLVTAVTSGSATFTARANLTGGTNVSATKDMTMSQF